MLNECVSAISGGSPAQVDLQNAESAKVDDDVSVVRPSQYPVRRSVSSQAVRKSAPQLSSAQSLRQGDQRGFSDIVRATWERQSVNVRHYR